MAFRGLVGVRHSFVAPTNDQFLRWTQLRSDSGEELRLFPPLRVLGSAVSQSCCTELQRLASKVQKGSWSDQIIAFLMRTHYNYYVRKGNEGECWIWFRLLQSWSVTVARQNTIRLLSLASFLVYHSS